ncbi:ankryin [Piscirickettsia litoralis]|uniref:Ankryin n=2 Tax=Piscirickettsia litoralis TaxID=1891921 RepID=A0ABX2ZYK2_9GAMM|nr:ankryin [Piscirickettsia litoralis]
MSMSSELKLLLKLAKTNNGESLKSFIKEHQSLLKERSDNQLTPLQVAVYNGSIETALIFIEYGGPPIIRAKFYSKKNRSSVIHYCLARGWDTINKEHSKLPFNKVIIAATNLMKERVFSLRDVYGINPLGAAVLTGQKQAADFFLNLSYCKKSTIEYEKNLVNKLRGIT